MDRISKEIFRSWNWPGEGNFNFSNRPTPYNISRDRFLSPSSVYKSWNYLFDNSYVKKVVLLPSDAIARRRAVILSGASHKDVSAIVSKMEDAYFLEMVHYGHVYGAGGVLENLRHDGEMISLELVDSPGELADKQARLVSGFPRSDIDVIPLPSVTQPTSNLTEKQIELVRKLAYGDLYKVTLKDTASLINTSQKTAGRWINRIIEENAMYAFPVLNQSAITGFNICVVIAQYETGKQSGSVLDSLKLLELISERYLLYRMMDGTLTLLLYYDSPGELDRIVDELANTFKSYALFTRFETYLNDHINGMIH